MDIKEAVGMYELHVAQRREDVTGERHGVITGSYIFDIHKSGAA